MAKVVLDQIEAGMGSVDKINSNFARVVEALDNTLSRDGAVPNQMEADLDLNGRAILNSGASDDPNRVLSYQQMVDYVGTHSSGLVVQRQERQIALAAQTVFNLQQVSYTPGSFNLAVYVNGVRQFAPVDYTETTNIQVVFTAPRSAGQVIEFVTNEFLGTIDLPAHTHPWSQITNVPVYNTRFPTWDEVTGKPTLFAPAAHTHAAADIATGRLADARRGVYVQASQPIANTVGELWFW